MEGVNPIILLILLILAVVVVRGLIRMVVGAGIDAARKQIDKNSGKYEQSESENLSDRFKK